ncbi:response regulator transcription factor [Rhodoblastus sp.]|jgi:DNA-binding response OmpR family regulator|uniref:response regulator transcription factor n=1 Tax=Rhodoblastus sp. TaxID=1962975 RepID=UPI002609A412|nr:response regulator transcription factor [Rhodoblastus sp.]
MNVLIIENDFVAGGELAEGLKAEGFDVTFVGEGEDPVETARALNPCAVLFDTAFPDNHDFEMCRAMRRSGRTAPILFLSQRHEATDRACGLNAGADDYIARPFQFDELIERLRAHLIHHSISADSSERRKVGQLVLDLRTRQAFYGGVHIRLTQREAELLSILMDNANQAVGRGEIYDQLWGGQGGTSLNVVDVYLGYLRTKFTEITRVGGPFISTVRGRGFMLDMAGYKSAAR